MSLTEPDAYTSDGDDHGIACSSTDQLNSTETTAEVIQWAWSDPMNNSTVPYNSR